LLDNGLGQLQPEQAWRRGGDRGCRPRHASGRPGTRE
jgi:hypothetical protein